MRILYYVPIIHSESDYGSLGPKITQAIERRLGREVVRTIETMIENYWKLVREKVLNEIKDFQNLIIYQDSFPVGEREKILKFFGYVIKDKPRSQNYLLIKKLLEKGAVLEGTEDMNLVKEQVEIYQAAVNVSDSWEQQRTLEQNAGRAGQLTLQRDISIARRINETLSADGRGILFIGKAHKVIEELDKLEIAGQLSSPIKVIYL